MKISPLRSFWIIIQSLFITLRVSVIAVFLASRKKLPRVTADKLARIWAYRILKIVKLRYVVSNPHNVKFEPHKRYILMSNHASHYDIPLLFAAFPGSVRMLAKKELSKIPIWGPGMVHCEFVFIERGNRAQAIKDLEFAKEKLESGIVLWVSPEGTRSRTGRLGKFKKGGFILAIQAQAIIVPVSIRGANRVLPPKSLRFSINESVSIHVGEPIDTADYAESDRDKLMQEVEKAIRLGLD